MAPDHKSIAALLLKIRDFRLSDLVRIDEIVRDSAEAAQWPLESYAKLAASSGGIFLVGEASGKPIGFLAARQVADEAEILNVAVLRDFRRKGIASALLVAALEKFRQSATARLYLELRESNLPARALYELHGFVLDGRRKSYYRDPSEDALCMRIKLTPASG
jgi:ribosomal-protein-alanine N-acetyltransferase